MGQVDTSKPHRVRLELPDGFLEFSARDDEDALRLIARMEAALGPEPGTWTRRPDLPRR